MVARKENKEYTVDINTKDIYLNDGYDIYNEKGKIIEYSPKKQVPISDYIALKDEKEKLEQKIVDLKEALKEATKEQQDTIKSNKKNTTVKTTQKNGETEITEETKKTTETTEENGETDADVQE